MSSIRTSLLMNCLWYEGISPEELADVLELTPEALFRKLFQEDEFVLEEIQRMTELLGLTPEEVDAIFYP